MSHILEHLSLNFDLFHSLGDSVLYLLVLDLHLLQLVSQFSLALLQRVSRAYRCLLNASKLITDILQELLLFDLECLDLSFDLLGHLFGYRHELAVSCTFEIK